MSSDEDHVDPWESLQRIGAIARGLQEAIDKPNWGEPQPGSELAEDDRLSSPFQVSHGVQQHINVAVECLHAIDALTRDTIYKGVPFILARTAIEASAYGIWTLTPPKRSERIRRRLSLQSHNLSDREEAEKDAGVDSSAAIAEARKSIAEVSKRSGCGPVSRRVGATSVLKAVSAHADMDLTVVWRISSGLAHGRDWAALSMWNREDMTELGDVVNLRLTSDLDKVNLAASAGCAALLTLIRRFDELRSA